MVVLDVPELGEARGRRQADCVRRQGARAAALHSEGLRRPLAGGWFPFPPHIAKSDT